MQLDQKIVTRLDELIAIGEQVTDKPFRGMQGGDLRERYGSVLLIQGQDAAQWGTSCLSILSRVFAAASDHYRKFDAAAAGFPRHESAKQAVGILKAAKDDYEHGYLFDTKLAITADVFSEFLDQAAYLLQQHYYQPAAVVAGAVLEDGLRKLCGKHGITLPDKPKLDTMNAELARKGVYNKLVQKQITALADLRNKAAHGEWTEFTEADVATMLPQVRALMAAHFS